MANTIKKRNISKPIGEKIIEFNKQLHYEGSLPEGFAVLNPFRENPETEIVMKAFYEQFYHDNNKRKFVIGINPSRNGAGITGVPFTDTKRLKSECGIEMKSAYSHEISSVFMYEVIKAYGGVHQFYSDFYINSPFPLAIIQKKNGNWINANYYDDKNLFECVKPFMIETLKKHISLGLDTENAFVLGKKNADFLHKINREEKFFEKLTALEHPRYIQQYQSKNQQLYIDKYLISFNEDALD